MTQLSAKQWLLSAMSDIWQKRLKMELEDASQSMLVVLVDLPKLDMMNEIKFEWTSTRKCGSSFMMRYREVAERLQDASSKNQVFQILEEDDQLRKWLYAQKCAFENGKLSDSRVQYMDDLCVDWRNFSF